MAVTCKLRLMTGDLNAAAAADVMLEEDPLDRWPPPGFIQYSRIEMHRVENNLNVLAYFNQIDLHVYCKKNTL